MPHPYESWQNALLNIINAWKAGDILHIYNAVGNNHKALEELERFLSAPGPVDNVGLTEEEKQLLASLTKDMQ